jgi:hypothetical protein
MISSTTLVNKEVGRKNFSFCFHLCATATEIKLSEEQFGLPDLLPESYAVLIWLDLLYVVIVD